ncbi:hypothetical protein DM02DRAFT_279088 [Periconia macrospinosa]|uniref:Mid2 domain-containing protein n=1 Tax=Periconia macrospinosa TaxID=97972 RepID=A0A2V1DZJ3_9PLEO|nr:hypothetical protein DM02DRAFT_279088 [Periconia macrospinosa]
MSLIRRDVSSSPTCYTLNGQKAPSSNLSYIPCNTTAIANNQHSSCCASTDLCLSNGLCKYNAPANVRPFNEYWRVGCTDPTYKDPACPKQCANVPSEKPMHLVFQCPGNGRWCCGTGEIETYKDRGTVNTTCCAMEDLAFDGGVASVFATASLDLKMNVEPSKTSAVGTTSVTSIATTPASATVASGDATSVDAPTAVPTPPPKSDTNVTTAVGIGIGIPVAVALIIGIAIFLFLRKRRGQADPLSNSVLSSGTDASFWKDSHPAPLATHQNPPNSRSLAFWRQKNEAPEYPVNLHSVDMRTTNPHAFSNEAHGKEITAELDTSRPPVEVWSPDAEPKPWTGEGADPNVVQQRMANMKYGFERSGVESRGPRSPQSPELPAYAYR